ncbi:hypothetical protein SDC9_126288 [bioreactor metagenome]|uniref:Uncharacterized protein n=1 Tax=bioreactor metagenome TaxID=1076179 RepID=A0A645CQS8_9ZZZZ
MENLQANDSALSVRVSAVETGLAGKAPASHNHDTLYGAKTAIASGYTYPSVAVGAWTVIKASSSSNVKLPAGGIYIGIDVGGPAGQPGVAGGSVVGSNNGNYQAYMRVS